LKQYNAVLVGGETCRVPDGSAAVISIAATGWVEREHLMLRSGGKPGDELWVTGKLGGSITGKHLSFSPRVEEARWLAENFGVTAMMDLSDGLAKDLPRLAKASGCEFFLDQSAIPISEACDLQQALGDGEDFELLFAASAGADVTEWGKRFPDVELTKIGQLVSIGCGQMLDGGWDHFS
jgi:thiamine-monophosphate kinase